MGTLREVIEESIERERKLIEKIAGQSVRRERIGVIGVIEDMVEVGD